MVMFISMPGCHCHVTAIVFEIPNKGSCRCATSASHKNSIWNEQSRKLVMTATRILLLLQFSITSTDNFWAFFHLSVVIKMTLIICLPICDYIWYTKKTYWMSQTIREMTLMLNKGEKRLSMYLPKLISIQMKCRSFSRKWFDNTLGSFSNS